MNVPTLTGFLDSFLVTFRKREYQRRVGRDIKSNPRHHAIYGRQQIACMATIKTGGGGCPSPPPGPGLPLHPRHKRATFVQLSQRAIRQRHRHHLGRCFSSTVRETDLYKIISKESEKVSYPGKTPSTYRGS